MKRLLLIGIILWSACSVFAGEQDRAHIEKWLQEAVSLPKDSCRTLHFAKKMLGVPYVAGTLDGNEEEQLVVLVDSLDCTTFVETVLAFCIADKRGERDYEGFRKALTQIRYRDGVLTVIHPVFIISAIGSVITSKWDLLRNVLQRPPVASLRSCGSIL